MSLPPERITVKRRRDEEPIEALYIQQKKYRPSAVWKLAGNENDQPTYAQPSVLSSGDTPSAFSHFPKVPIVRSTTPSADTPKQARHVSTDPQMTLPSERAPAPFAITRPIRQGQKPQESAYQPRIFHLAKSSLKISSPYSICKTSTQRNLKKKGNQLAVFVEMAKRPKEISSSGRHFDADEASPETWNRRVNENIEMPRKRPNATAAERKWRAENWEKSTESRQLTEQRSKVTSHTGQPPQNWDHESPKLAALLQNFALEEMKAQDKHLKKSNDGQRLKMKPQPPKPRRTVTNATSYEGGEDDVMTDTTPLDDDPEYVFDTYVRSIAHPNKTSGVHDPVTDFIQNIDHSNMGVLVIGEGDEETLWETFGGEVDNDPDWNSEEEDENAEDFYGNDYPEDEVNSDDEFDRGAYRYRHYLSDDEEFSVDEPHWSDSDETPRL